MSQHLSDRHGERTLDAASADGSGWSQQQVLSYYTQPGELTSPGRFAPSFADLPRDVAGLTRVLHGLIIHEHIAPNYGVTLTPERRNSVHIRSTERILERLFAEDGRSLTVARTPERRLAGNCRHFSLLLTAMLRAQGTPARARCGFGAYFGSGNFEDHWVGEYWNSSEQQWVLVDAQIDNLQRGMFQPDFDLLNVPRHQFVTAGDAWRACRSGSSDPARYGLTPINETGLWWIAGNLLRDAAALNNMEMLPWDVWGLMPGPPDALSEEELSLLDQVAELTVAPDRSFASLRTLYASDPRLHVPGHVRNAVLGRIEAV